MMSYAEQNCMVEWFYVSNKKYKDPFNEVELSAVVTDPDGQERVIPAFWAGGQKWCIRYSSPKTGRHHFCTVCSDVSNTDLHGKEGDIEISVYSGDNPLLKHGPLRVSDGKRHLEHIDGMPFFWLADTWWMGLCKRLKWPKDFQTLALDRIDKGFSVIQIVAGLYPDMKPFDERGANEAGFPWEEGYERINPAYFDKADERINYLIDLGLVPCIVGCWGYFLNFMGIEKIKKHWRNLVARYGAYPVVWCLAGEYDMPYYLSTDQKRDREAQRLGWKEIGTYLREVDPYHNPITVHPGSYTREVPGFADVFDFDMLQTGHSDDSIGNTVFRIHQSYQAEPVMPVIDGEVAYEGIGGQCKEQVQRLMFWACVLNGAAGHTYGANGIWQVNTKEKPFGPSPHGMSWGDTPWEEAYKLPGSYQLALSKKLLERYKWWLFEPHPEWIEVNVSEEKREHNYYPYIAGIPQKVRIIYLPFFYPVFKIKNLEKGVSYKVFLFNPISGDEIDCGIVRPEDGEWSLSRLPIFQDWVLVMESIDNA
ncbi:DUF4038 domain-containing protein [Mahella australiensis]|uniref:DUF4038 domain-containing protein n=1 Tax=Mahella australiensis (strain DSM 15567 / CIP 107919 / 50-1 BON) TaxID=697281 RepID=F3ZW23_MAHA5|nr:DUF4038 domain-containing protein [Mahella australiensis]AEE96403.1 hypothetical protein Mahau_1207 [Mahella australiensis 50-1 BON]